MPDTVLITGCNRGIGLELARQYAEEGCRVIATCRQPETAQDLQALAERHGNLSVYPLDVTDYAAVHALAGALRGTAIDILISNAGVYGPKGVVFGAVDPEVWRQVLEVNTIAPYMLVEAFCEHVAAGQRRVIGVLSSKVGSIADNGSGGGYMYRSSKTALNQVVKSLSIDLADRGIQVLALHPGWVQTDMGGPNALISAEQSVAGIRQLLDAAGVSHTGRFHNYDGEEIPW